MRRLLVLVCVSGAGRSPRPSGGRSPRILAVPTGTEGEHFRRLVQEALPDRPLVATHQRISSSIASYCVAPGGRAANGRDRGESVRPGPHLGGVQSAQPKRYQRLADVLAGIEGNSCSGLRDASRVRAPAPSPESPATPPADDTAAPAPRRAAGCVVNTRTAPGAWPPHSVRPS